MNHEYRSQHFSSRNGEAIQFLVLHYTDVPLATTLGIFTNNIQLAEQDAADIKTSIDLPTLCNKTVSAHYVNDETGQLYQLVDESCIAHHAGVSYWSGVKNLNAQSIGIEQVNLGYGEVSPFPATRGRQVSGSERIWCLYTEPQIQTTIQLCQQIIQRYHIKPYNVVGHSDIACDRKVDPGPMFPWARLAAAGVGLWYDLAESQINAQNMPNQPVLWTRNKLFEFGYDCPLAGEFDDRLQTIMTAFQMHFRPSNIDGNIDLESMQILDSLCQRKWRYGASVR